MSDPASRSRDESEPWLPDNWRELAPLVDAVLDAPPERRAAVLAEVSGGDPVRRAELERLVAERERVHSVFDRPAAERFAGLFDDAAVLVPASLAERYPVTRELGRAVWPWCIWPGTSSMDGTSPSRSFAPSWPPR